MCSCNSLAAILLLVLIFDGSLIDALVEKKKIDFVLVIDRSPPQLSNWAPSQSSVSSSAETNKLHFWVVIMIKELFYDSYLKNVDSRILVLTLFENTVTKEGDFYSHQHTQWIKYNIPRLRTAYVRLDPKRFEQIQPIVGKIRDTIAKSKPKDRALVPDIVIWHVMYDGSNPKDVRHWRILHYDIVDVMIGLWDYWDMARNPTRAVVDQVFSMDAYSLNFYTHLALDKRLAKDIWNIVESCHSAVNISPCHFNAAGACVMIKTYSSIGNSKYCMHGIELVDCPYGNELCLEECRKATFVGGECSVTCDLGTKQIRPDPTNVYVRHCPGSWTTECYPGPCDATQSGAQQTTKQPINVSADVPIEQGTSRTTTMDGIVLQPWVITLITVGCLAFMAIVIGIVIWFTRKRQKGKSARPHGHQERYGRHGQSRESRTDRFYSQSKTFTDVRRPEPVVPSHGRRNERGRDTRHPRRR